MCLDTSALSRGALSRASRTHTPHKQNAHTPTPLFTSKASSHDTVLKKSCGSDVSNDTLTPLGSICITYKGASLVAQTVKNLPAMQETWVRSLGREVPLEKGMATLSCVLAWKSHEQRNLVKYSPWGRKESDMPERLTLSLHFTMGRETDGILSLGPVAPSFSCISTSDPLSTTCVFILLAPEKSQDDQIGMSDTEVK